MEAEQNMAFPLEADRYDPQFGLTKREYFAGLAMQGLIIESVDGLEDIAPLAVQHADALLAELEKAK